MVFDINNREFRKLLEEFQGMARKLEADRPAIAAISEQYGAQIRDDFKRVGVDLRDPEVYSIVITAVYYYWMKVQDLERVGEGHDPHIPLLHCFLRLAPADLR